jgi:2,4-dienoyl-CoA reductase-like NADH-dependent reductase (Old Yellow Enzyme family)
MVSAPITDHCSAVDSSMRVKVDMAPRLRPSARFRRVGRPLRSTVVIAGLLHEPLTIGGTTTVRNRLYRAPVLEGAGDGPECVERYARSFVPNAEAGVGLIIQGSACIYPEGRTSPGMTRVDDRDRVLRLAPMVDQVHGGLYSMEGWHEPYASERRAPLPVPSKLSWYLRASMRGVPTKVMTTEEVHAMAVRYAEVAMWAREAGYDGIQLASSNAKLLDQFLSPFYNRRDDEFGGSVAGRGNVLRVIRERIAERAGADFTCTVKVPVGEKAPPLTPRSTREEGLELARLCQEWGFDSVTPVEVGVLPDTTLSRGGIPTSLWRNPSMKARLRKASPGRTDRFVLEAGYVLGSVSSPFKPVWNRTAFTEVKDMLDIPVLAVGGIRTSGEVNAILDDGQADLVGIGRPFYAEPDLPQRILGGAPTNSSGLCRNSNLCVPAQMLGMKGVCYNPDVVRIRPRS